MFFIFLSLLHDLQLLASQTSTYPFCLNMMSASSKTRLSSSRTSSELLVEVEDTL